MNRIFMTNSSVWQAIFKNLFQIKMLISTQKLKNKNKKKKIIIQFVTIAVSISQAFALVKLTIILNIL